MKASALPLILVLTAAFLIIISSMADFVTLEARTAKRTIASQRAFNIAEAGLEYYKWRLAHFPNDFQDGTGGAGPYIHPYYDPQGGQMGQFSLAITPHNSCAKAQWVDIISTGETLEFPTVKKKLQGRYARPSIAKYAFITNEGVWLGPTEIARGLFHSNKGIRMDGINDSLVTSALATWNCTPSFGCGSPFQVKPGIFGSGVGGAQGLWKFPVAPIDFTLISGDLVQIKQAAQTSGVYIPRPSDIGYPSAKGYHIIFNNDGTITVNVVKTTQFVYAYSPETHKDYKSYEVINQEAFYNTYTLPASCSAMFLEGDVWMEGQVNGKLIIASANLIDANIDTSVILNNNITYASTGSGLTVIAERNIRIPLYSPNVMTLNGIFVAQKGFFGRDFYDQGHTPWHIRQQLNIKGTLLSNLQSVTQWVNGGNTTSGYKIEDNIYDSLLATAPPPLTPFTDSDYKFVKWEEL